MVASVPELTSRTISTGARATISSASSTSPGVAAPNDVPRASASATAPTTAGWVCPRIIGPQEQMRSTYWRPSTSNRYGPAPRSMNLGTPPTGPNARTGEFTPPGVTAAARANSSALRSPDNELAFFLAGVNQELEQPQRVGQRLPRGLPDPAYVLAIPVPGGRCEPVAVPAGPAQRLGLGEHVRRGVKPARPPLVLVDRGAPGHHVEVHPVGALHR